MIPRNFQRASVITFAVIAFLLGSAPSVAEGSGPAASKAAEPASDEPRHIPTVKPFGPYRLIQPPAQRTEKAEPKPEPKKTVRPVPQWKNNRYVIQAGDTLSKIAPFLKVSYVELAKCSGIANPHRISIGQKLHKPGSCVPPPKVTPSPKPTQQISSPANASGSAATVINFALAQLGDPYVWGGNGPNGWDCSGLMVGAFRQAGISLPRTSRAQFTVGTSVGYGQWAPGDLLFYGSSAASIHHVALFIGNGQLVHASTFGVPVKTASAPSGGGSDYLGAKRVL